MNITIQTFANINTVLITLFLLLGIVAMIVTIVAILKIQGKVNNIYNKAESTMESIHRLSNLPLFFIESIMKKFIK